MKNILAIILTLLSSFAYAQDDSKYKPEEIKEFYRQAKLTEEYMALKRSVDTNNAQEKMIPQEVKFIIEHHRQEGPNAEKEKNLLHGFVYIDTELGKIATAYLMTYDRTKKKIVAIKKSNEKNPTRHSDMP